jgi:hypothetical protein
LGGYLAPPNIGNSNYHSVTFKYEKRFSNGLSLLAHYTFSKMISDGDVASGDVSFLGGNASVQDWFNLHLEKSISAFDVPHRFVSSFDYQLPIGRNKALGRNMSRVANGFLGGWEIGGVVTFMKAMPLIPTDAASTLWDAAQRPNLIGDPSMPGTIEARMNNYFNVNAFSHPAPDTYGTGPRTLPTYRGPGTKNADMTFMKNFMLTESRRIQVRLEAYNATNTPHWGNPNVSYGNTSFGIISSASNARSVQVAGKFYW